MSFKGVFYDIEKERAINEIKCHFDDSEPFFQKRTNLAIGILNFLLHYYDFDCLYIDYVKRFALLLELRQFSMFCINDYLNPQLFQKRLVFTLLNQTDYDYSGNKVNIKSNHFIEDSQELKNIKYRKDYTGTGIMKINKNKILIANFKNGWIFGKARIYSPFFKLLEVIEDYDDHYESFLNSLL